MILSIGQRVILPKLEGKVCSGRKIAKIDGYIKLMKIRAIEEMKNDRL